MPHSSVFADLLPAYLIRVIMINNLTTGFKPSHFDVSYKSIITEEFLIDNTSPFFPFFLGKFEVFLFDIIGRII